MLGRFPGRPFLGQYPVQQFRAFWEVTKRYAELTRSDPLIHRSVAGAVNGLLDFLEVENVSAFQVTFFEMLSAWSASFLADTTRISRGMNHRACKERRPCVGTFVSFRQGCLRNVSISVGNGSAQDARTNRSESDHATGQKRASRYI